MPHKVVLTTLQFIQTQKKTNRPLLLAFSGGPDSLALFFALLDCRVDFQVAHIDHGWRAESGAQAAELQEFAGGYKIPFHLKTLSLSADLSNIEEISREKRYEYLLGVAKEIGAEAVVLGHQAEDQAETVLKRIFEGAPFDRCKGMTEVGDRNGVLLWRPLLQVSKNEIFDFLHGRKVKPIIDPTNFDPKYLRAKMRVNLIPILSEEFGKQVVHPLVGIGEEAGEIDRFLSERTAELREKYRGGEFDFSQEKFDRVEWRYFFRWMARERGRTISREIVGELARVFEGHEKGIKRFSVGGEVWVVQNSRLRFDQ